MADNNFEQNVKDRMEEFKLPPSAALWQQVQSQLQKDKRKRRWFFIWLPVTALLLGGSIYTMTKQTTKNHSIAESKIITEKNSSPAATNRDNNVKESLSQETQQSLEVKDDLQTGDNQPADIEVISEKNTSPAAADKESVTVQRVKEEKREQVTKGTAQINRQQNPVTNHTPAKAVVEKRTVAKKLPPASKASFKKDDGLVSGSAKKEDKPDVAVVVADNNKQQGTIQNSQITLTKKEDVIGTVDSVKNTVNTIVTQPDTAAIVKISTPTADVVNTEKPSVSATPSKPAKNKWQWGFQVNGGVASIGTFSLPFAAYKRENAMFSSGGSIAGIPQSRVVDVYNYEISNNLQFGGGIVLRKKISKRLSFVTGAQYQYSSFTAIEKLRRDSFPSATNQALNLSDRKTTKAFKIHYINIPTELQWQILKRKSGSLNLSAGVQHYIRAGRKEQGSLPQFISPDRYQVSMAVTSKVLYQPMLHFAPSYEWQKKKHTYSLGVYFNYGLLKVYNAEGNYHWRQTGLTFRYFFPGK